MISNSLPQPGESRDARSRVPVSAPPAVRGQILARGALPPRWEASLSAATLSLCSLQVSQLPPPPPPKTRLTRLSLGTSAVVMVGVMLGVFGARVAIQPAPEAAAAVTQRPFVSVALRSTTPGARFRFEDGRVVANPYVGLVPRDEREQAVWVEAPGYLPKKIAVAFGDDVTIDDVSFDAESSRAAPPRRRPEQGGGATSRPASTR